MTLSILNANTTNIMNTNTNTSINTKTNIITFVSSLRFLMWSLGWDWSESLEIVRWSMIFSEVRSLDLR